MKRLKSLVLLLNAFAIVSLTAAEKINIAVIDLEANDIKKAHVRILTNKLRSELVKTGRYQVLERDNMEEILKEQGFQQLVCTDQACIVKVGQIVGVEKMVSGSIGKLGKTYLITLRIIDVAKGLIEKSANREIKGGLEEVLEKGIPWSVAELTGKTPDKSDIGSDQAERGNFESPDSRAPEIIFMGFPLRNVKTILDHDEELFLDGDYNTRIRKPLSAIPVGRHVMHYNVSYIVRYYQTFEIKPGRNVLKPNFKYNGLPGLSCNLYYGKETIIDTSLEKEKTGSYISYVNGIEKRQNNANIRLKVSVKCAGKGRCDAKHEWYLGLNGKKTKKRFKIKLDQNQKQRRIRTQIIYRDPYHFYIVKIRTSDGSTELSAQGIYIGWLDHYKKRESESDF